MVMIFSYHDNRKMIFLTHHPHLIELAQQAVLGGLFGGA